MTRLTLADGNSYGVRELQRMALLDVESEHEIQYRSHEKRTGSFLKVGGGTTASLLLTNPEIQQRIRPMTDAERRARGLANPPLVENHIVIEWVEVPSRLRELDESKVEEIIESIKANGLLTPISVSRYKGGDLILVVGLHRLEAARRLGWTSIPAFVYYDLDEVERGLIEVDENLVRAELTGPERDEHLRRRKELFEARRNLELGGSNCATQVDSRGQKKSPQQERGFAAEAADITDMSKSAVNKGIRRAESIFPEVKRRMKKLGADSDVERDAVASLSGDEQLQAMERVDSGASENFRDARDFIRGEGVEEDRRHKQWMALHRAWHNADDDVRADHIAAIKGWAPNKSTADE